MTIWKLRAMKKPSGGTYSKFKKKKKREVGRDPSPTVVGDNDIRTHRRLRGGKLIPLLVKAQYANISDGTSVKKVKIITVEKNPANRHFARRNVITKGAIVKTEAGSVRVTSRPSKDGIVNAILVK